MTEATTTAPVETKNEAVPELMPDPITFTDAAVAKVKSLMDEEGNPDLKLRVFVQGGGCAGFQYGFTFDETQNDDDAVMQKGGVPERCIYPVQSAEKVFVKLVIMNIF